MKTKAVIFDKDGTLMDFDSFWVNVSREAIGDILCRIKQEQPPVEEILEALGVTREGTDINGVLCQGTYRQVGQVIYNVLSGYGCDCTEDEIVNLTVEAYHGNTGKGIMKPACENIGDVLNQLKRNGIKLAVATTDDAVVTKRCLQELGIEDYFDIVYTDDGKTPHKPDPYCIHDFCERNGLSHSEVVMVGDTLTDTQFAKNGGIRVIGVAKEERNRLVLEQEAELVVPDISYVYEVLQ